MLIYIATAAKGAIVVEWNVKQAAQGLAGMWDTHIRSVLDRACDDRKLI